jgi:hypothetical protein
MPTDFKKKSNHENSKRQKPTTHSPTAERTDCPAIAKRPIRAIIEFIKNI